MSDATLVILPGWGGSHETWAEFALLANQKFADVVVIDLPCFGDEPCPTEVWGVEEYSAFVQKQIVQLPNRPIVLLGHSFGGAVAAHLVANNPQTVDALVLSGAAVYRPKNYVRRAVFVALAKIGKIIFSLPGMSKVESWAKRILYRVADSPDYDQTSGIKRDIFRKIIRQDQGHVLKNISVPTAVIQGTRDTYVPHRFGKRIAENIPQSTFISVDEGTHGLHLKKKKVFLDQITSFLNSVYGN